MGSYNKSIYDAELLFKRDKADNYDSVLILPINVMLAKALLPDDLLFKSEDGTTFSGAKKIKMEPDGESATIVNVCTMRILKTEKMNNGRVTAYYLTNESSNMAESTSRCKKYIENIIRSVYAGGSYTLPQELNDCDVAICLNCVQMMLDCEPEPNDVARANFAAAVWNEGTYHHNMPAMDLLSAKNTPGKIVLVATLGNYSKVQHAFCVKPGSTLNFTSGYTNKYAVLIKAIQSRSLKDVGAIANSLTQSNLNETYCAYAMESGLPPECADALLMADVISMLCDNKQLGNISADGRYASGLVLNQCMNPTYIERFIKTITENYNIFSMFKSRYLFENSRSPQSFRTKDSNIFEHAVEVSKRKMKNIVDIASRIPATGGAHKGINISSRDYYEQLLKNKK